MNPIPMLLDKDRVRSRGTPEKLRTDHLLKEFGALLECRTLPPEPPDFGDLADESPELHAEWRRCVAEELLLLHACGREVPPAWHTAFAAVSPFAAQVPLNQCLERRAACAVFPLAGEDSPGVGHVWVMEGVDHRDERNGTEVISSRFGVCFVTTHQSWHGRSWQLAGVLAQRCLEVQAKPTIRGELARLWIITGRVQDEHTVAVNLGNKLELRTPRQWLLPLDNLGNVPSNACRLHIRSAIDVDGAWSHISGEGIRGDGEQAWPARVDELHILIGGSIKAAVASALFCPPGTRIQLWHSGNRDSSEIPAQATRLILSRVCPQHVVLEPQLLSSANLAQAEATLREAFQDCPVDRRVLFNVTSGNRLMSYAVLTVARARPNIELIYRDLDAKPFEFTRIDYSEFPPVTGIYRAASGTASPVKWDFLFTGGRRETVGNPEEMADNFLKELLQ